MKKLSTHQRKARDFLQREDWENALSELQNVLTSDANNPTLHNQIGDVFLRKNDVELACEHFEKSIELYAQLGLHNNAVALCRKVVRLCPERIEVRYRLALLRADQGLRADAVASLEDYFEQLNPDSEEAVKALEERSREVINDHPDMAPVGKILEKLESARAFVAAFEIVRRLAQRATDAGEDDAARRYTEKMRSLRVLVEGNGGGDLLANDAEVPESASVKGDPSLLGAAPSEQPIQMTSPAEESAISGLDLDLRPAPGQLAPETVPETLVLETPELANLGLDLSSPQAPAAPSGQEYDAVELSLSPDSTPAPPEGVKASMATPGSSPDSETVSLAGSLTANRNTFAEPSPSDADRGQEYELPETSLAEIAGLLQDDEPPTEPSVADTPPAQAVADRWLRQEAEAAGFQEVANQNTVGPVAPVAVANPQQPAAQTAPAIPEEPVTTTPALADAAQAPESAPRRETVWIPHPSIQDENPNPGDHGETQELNVVIETFREQMAQALGEDSDARYDLGVAYYEMGLYTEALAEFEVAVRCGPFRDRSLEMMAACLMNQGRHAEIVELLSPALETDEQTSLNRLGLRYSMGLAFEALGRSEEARRHFEEVALVDGGFKDVQARLQRF